MSFKNKLKRIKKVIRGINIKVFGHLKSIRLVYVDLTIVSIFMLFILIYENLETKLELQSSNAELNFELGQHVDGTCILLIKTKLEFRNTSLKPGSLQNVNITTLGINSDIDGNFEKIDAEVIRIDKRKINRFSTEKIQINIWINFADCLSLEDIVEFKMTFNDNQGGFVFKQNKNTEATFFFKPEVSFDKNLKFGANTYVIYGNKKKN